MCLRSTDARLSLSRHAIQTRQNGFQISTSSNYTEYSVLVSAHYSSLNAAPSAICTARKLRDERLTRLGSGEPVCSKYTCRLKRTWAHVWSKPGSIQDTGEQVHTTSLRCGTAETSHTHTHTTTASSRISIVVAKTLHECTLGIFHRVDSLVSTTKPRIQTQVFCH